MSSSNNTNHLFFVTFVVLFGMILVVFAVDFLLRSLSSEQAHWPQNVLPKSGDGEKYELVLLGNSHSQSGVTFEKYNARALNLSSVAQRFSYDLAYLKHHRAEIEPGALIIINASPLSFSHAPPKPESGFQASYYGRITPFFIPDLNWGDYLEQEFLSFSRSGFMWRQQHDKKIQEKRAQEDRARFATEKSEASQKENQNSQDSLPPVFSQTSTSVPAEDLKFNVEYISRKLENPERFPEKMRNGVNFMFNKWYRTDEFSPDYFEKNRKDLEEIIAFSLEQSWRPVVITIPISQELQDGLLDDYMQTYVYDNVNQANFHDTEYIDFSQDKRITTNTDWFSNSDHLNPDGAAAFSYILLQKLMERGYLEKSMDGYDYSVLSPKK